jgi:hypothetical protein
MNKVTSLTERLAVAPWTLSALALALGVAFASLAPDAAWACRGFRGWSTGLNLEKLKPGEIVVRAKLLESFKSEQSVPIIMGLPNGMIYDVHISKVIGGPGVAQAGLKDSGNERILIHLPPSVCETYFPRDFMPNSEKVLVLKKDPEGIFVLVGGEE